MKKLMSGILFAALLCVGDAFGAAKQSKCSCANHVAGGACAKAAIKNKKCVPIECPKTVTEKGKTYNAYMVYKDGAIQYYCHNDAICKQKGQVLNTWTEGGVTYTDKKCIAEPSQEAAVSTPEVKPAVKPEETPEVIPEVTAPGNCGNEIKLSNSDTGGKGAWVGHWYRVKGWGGSYPKNGMNDYVCTSKGKHLDIYQEDGVWYTYSKMTCVDNSKRPGCTQAHREEEVIEVKPEVKPEETPEVKQEVKPEETSEATSEVAPEVRTEVILEAKPEVVASVDAEVIMAARSSISDAVATIGSFISSLNVSEWKDAEGNFNAARLTSDSIAGVVLGTAGGLISSNVVKKHQVEEGFEDISCAIGSQTVAGWGDEFVVGVQ